MKRLAVFVEGQTELVFVETLLREVAGYQRISVHLERKIGSGIVSLKSWTAGPKTGAESYAALIYDCQGEGTVKSAVLERMIDLRNKGYDTILGLRDLYPLKLADRKKLIHGMNHDLVCPGLKLRIIVAVMEVEAWFLKEANHFLRLDASLTSARIGKLVGFDPAKDDVTKVRRPSAYLKTIYKSVGHDYKKKRGHVERTVALLDYDNLYLGVTKEVESLAVFLQHIDEYLIPA